MSETIQKKPGVFKEVVAEAAVFLAMLAPGTRALAASDTNTAAPSKDYVAGWNQVNWHPPAAPQVPTGTASANFNESANSLKKVDDTLKAVLQQMDASGATMSDLEKGKAARAMMKADEAIHAAIVLADSKAPFATVAAGRGMDPSEAAIATPGMTFGPTSFNDAVQKTKMVESEVAKEIVFFTDLAGPANATQARPEKVKESTGARLLRGHTFGLVDVDHAKEQMVAKESFHAGGPNNAGQEAMASMQYNGGSQLQASASDQLRSIVLTSKTGTETAFSNGMNP